MRSALVGLLITVGAATVAAGDDETTPVPLQAVTVSFSEEEGGSAHHEYLPSGWLHFTGHASCCGYKPPLADGWYRLTPAAARALFDDAARVVALGQFQTTEAAVINGTAIEIVTA